MKTKWIFLLLLAFPALAIAQGKAAFRFEVMTKDVGEVKEEKGPVSVTFHFVNAGKDTLKIAYIKSSKPSLSCAYSKFVPPGKPGVIDVTFNPKGTTGKFSSTLTVFANTQPAETVLGVIGIVNSKNAGPYQKYPFASGNLRSTGNLLNLHEIYNTTIVTDTILLYNNLNRTMKIDTGYVPEAVIKIRWPRKLKSHKSGRLILTYDASKKKDWGLVQDKIELRTNDSLMPEKLFSVVASISEDFSSLTPEQKAAAAHCKVDNPAYNFGTIQTGEVVRHDFLFTNTGKSVLHIRKVKASCGCTVPFVEKNEVQPGETVKVSAEFNSRGRSGPQSKQIHVICNDPDNPSFVLTIEGNVK